MPVQSQAGQSHAGQSHAVQSHAVQSHAVQSHAGQAHAGLGHAGQGHAGLVNGVKPTAPQTVTLPGEVRLVADANCVSSTPLANGITLPGEVGVVALSRTYGRRRVNRKKSVFCFHHSRSIGAPSVVRLVAAANSVSSTPPQTVTLPVGIEPHGIEPRWD